MYFVSITAYITTALFTQKYDKSLIEIILTDMEFYTIFIFIKMVLNVFYTLMTSAINMS